MEQPLLPYESCILGAINLAKVHDEKYGGINYKKLEELVRNAVEFLDLAIDKNKYPFEELRESAQKYRKIGVGVMGWAELLIRLDMRYGSQESLDLAEEISNFIDRTAIEKSEELAEEKGVFPGFDNTTIETPRRNAVLTTVAPTGSRSFIANTSGGIEPFYNIEGYTHTDADGEETEFMFDFMENASDYALVGSLDINPLDHVYMQSAWQKNIGSAVSKTVNLPNDATVDDVDKIYRTAHKTKCKGITIYRDGSKTSQVLNSNEDGEEEIQEVEEINVKTSPAKAHSKRYKLKTGCGTLYFIPVFDDAGNLIEVFNSTSNGGCGSFTEATSRMISLALRAGVSLEEIIDQLQSINPCPSYMYSKGKGEDVDLGSSCPSAIANKLRRYVDGSEDILETKVEEKKKEKDILDDKNICPECGEGKLQMESGCVHCSICGWSKCG